MKLQGKIALVTGGGAGIGAAITKRFVEEGAKVCITGRRKDVLDKMAQSFPEGSVATCPGDVSKDKDVARMVETAVKFGGKLDVLVNNAGISIQGPVADLDRANWHQVMGVNLHGPFMLMQESIPHMIKAGGGSIINIASLGGLRCLPGFPAYCTSKAGLIMLTKQAALDYGAHNIRCNAVCPGGIKTEMTEKEFGQFGNMLGMEPDAYLDLIAEEMPLKRFGEPKEIGGVCTFLASDDSSFMTGAALVVDAGTAIVDVVGASIMGSLRRGGVI
jgi:meso-butanediol dehydrogenase/(S,S)-butanediol dehydrogenase/diacetyl reductase